MEEDCPSCLEKGIKSSVTFWQITLDSAVLACNNLNCSFPFDREYRDVIWKRNFQDINKERNPKVKLEDVTLKDVKPIDDYFNHLELPDIIANETVETPNTSAVGSSSLSVDFSTLLALSEEDAQPLVVNEEWNPDNPVSESQCINNSNNSYKMDNSPYIMGDLSFLEIDGEPAEMRTTKGGAVEETHSDSESDSGIPVIEIESEDEEEKHDNLCRAAGDSAVDEDSLSAINENLQSEIEENSSGRDGSFKAEESSLVDSNDKNVTGKNPVSVDGVKTYIVICKDVVPTFDVDQLKRNGISVQILNPNSNVKSTDKDEQEISSFKEIIGSDYSSPERISSKPGRPYNVVEDKVRIWLGDNLGSECEMVITAAHLFRYIVQNFVSKPENRQISSAAVDRKVEVVSPTSSEEVRTISENLSTVTTNDSRNFYAETDSVPSKEAVGKISRDGSEQWSRKASERFSMLKSLTTPVSSNSSTKLISHSNLLTPLEKDILDGVAFLPSTVAECTEELHAPYVTKRRRIWKKMDIMKHESVLDDSNATTSDSTKDTPSDEQTLDELNEGFLQESCSSSSPIRTPVLSKSVKKFGSLVKTSPIVRQARLIKYKANRFRRQVTCSTKSKVAHWRKPVILPGTTLESSDVPSSLNNKSIAPGEPSTPFVEQFDLLKTKIAQLTEICTQSPDSTHLGNVPASTVSLSAEESVSSSAEECNTACVSESISTSSDKFPMQPKTIPSTKTPLPRRRNCSVRLSSPIKCRIPQLVKSVTSSSDSALTMHSEEELVICNEESFTPCEANSSTSRNVNSAAKSTSSKIDTSTSVSKCILLNEQTQPSCVDRTVQLCRSYECERKELGNIYKADTIPSHALSPSPTIVGECYSQRSKRIHVKRVVKKSSDSTYMEVNREKLSCSNNTGELSEISETISEECVSDLASLSVRGQTPPRSDVPQLKGPVRPSPKSNSVKSDKPSDVQETIPPLTELYETKSVTSYDRSLKELAPSASATTAVKHSPHSKSYRSRKSFTPPVKSMRIRKSVASSIKSKVTYLRKTRVGHLRKHISKSPVPTIVQPPRTKRESLLSSASDDLDKSQLSSSTSNVEMKPEHNVTRRSAVADSASLKLSVHDSALKRSRTSVLSATSVQSSLLQRTTGTASRKTVAPAQNLELDLGSGSASVEQPVRCTRSTGIVTEKSVSHSLHTKPVTLSNTAVKRSSLNKLSASPTSNKLKTRRTTRRATKLSCSMKTCSHEMAISLVEASPMKTRETGKCGRSTTCTARRSNSVIAVSESKKSTASCVLKSRREAAEIKSDISPQAASVTEVSPLRRSCREAAEIKPDESPQAASIKELSPVRKSRRQKHLLQQSRASSPTKTSSLDLSSTRLLESNLKQNLKCSNVSVVILKSPAATAALLKLRKESTMASGIQPIMQSTDCSREKLGIHRMGPVKEVAAPLSRAYVKLHRISVREGFNLRHISKFMKEKDTLVEGNCRTVFPSKSQKSVSYLQQRVPPSEPSILELSKKDSIEKENIANSKKRRKYSVDERSKPNLSSSEENVPRISSSVVLKSQSEQLTAKSRVLLTRVSPTSLSNKNLSKQVNSICTKGVVSREDVNTRRLVKRVAHQSRSISSVKEQHNVQPKLDVTSSSYSVKGLVSQERSPRAFNLLKVTPVRSSARKRSCNSCKKC